MARVLLAILLTLALLPTVETVEQLVHLVEHGAGDAAHEFGHHEHEDDGAGGCAEFAHLGMSVVGAPVGARTATPTAPRTAGAAVAFLAVDAWRGLGSTAPPLRPPIG